MALGTKDRKQGATTLHIPLGGSGSDTQGTTPKNPDGSGIGTVPEEQTPKITPTSYEDAEAGLDKTKAVTGSDDRIKGVDKWASDYKKRIDDEYRSNLDPNWNKDLAKMGQLTGRSFLNNVSLSRMADAYNNRRHVKATDIGHRTLHYGVTGTGADQAGSERWEPIETQEMRQMRENERMNEQVRRNDIERQNKVRNYNYDISRDMDKYVADYADFEKKLVANLYDDIARARTDVEYRQKMQTYLSEVLSEYEQGLRMYWNEHAINMAMRFTNDPEIKTMIIQAFSVGNMTGLGAYQRAMGDLQTQMWNKALEYANGDTQAAQMYMTYAMLNYNSDILLRGSTGSTGR